HIQCTSIIRAIKCLINPTSLQSSESFPPCTVRTCTQLIPSFITSASTIPPLPANPLYSPIHPLPQVHDPSIPSPHPPEARPLSPPSSPYQRDSGQRSSTTGMPYPATLSALCSTSCPSWQH